MLFDKLRQIKFGSMGGSGSKMEYVFAASLGLVIFLSVGLTINYIYFDNPAGSIPDKYYYYCTACNKEIVIKSQELAENQSLIELADMPGQKSICPRCKQRGLLPETKCPICDKYFISDSMLNPDLDSSKDEICKKCNGNISSYFRNKNK